MRAVRVAEPLRLMAGWTRDVYREVQPITGFIQQVPDEGAPATEQTEAWLLFDGENIYIGVRCHDSAPPHEWVANDMRRDTPQLRQNDTFAVIFDTFYDRRNGVAFYTNPLGARADFAITNEGQSEQRLEPGVGRPHRPLRGRLDRRNGDPVQVAALPARRGPGVGLPDAAGRAAQERGLVTSRRCRFPRCAAARSAGIFRVSDAATLVGLEAPQGSRNVEIKPFAIGGVFTDRQATPVEENARRGDAGLDVKVGVTQNLTADFTYRTDFAQVEVDEQQINLTRFNRFFPEKREFFLEGRGIFQFATGAAVGGPRRIPLIRTRRSSSTAGGSACRTTTSYRLSAAGG